MSTPDFELARKRALARRQTHLLAAQSLKAARSSTSAIQASARLPYPLNNLTKSSITAWDTIKGRDGTRPAFRVGQVDAELLDEELLELLRGQVGEGLKYFRGAHLREEWASEILLGLRTVLWKLCMWDHDTTYGAMLQNLRYSDARHTGLVPRLPTRWQKAWYGVWSVGGRYAWEKWEIWLAEKEGGYDSSPTSRIRILSRLSSLASTAHSIAALSSFLLFLLNGRYRTLLDRILRLRLTSPSNHLSRQVSFEYLNRQLVWHAFTEFLLFLLPLVGISRWRRWLARAWQRVKTLVRRRGNNGGDEDEDMTPRGELSFLPERTCAICYQDQNPTSGASETELLAASSGGASGGVVGSASTDITNPYEMVPCGCVYCFVCAISKLEAADGEGWICLKCGLLVKECKPWTADVLEAGDAPKSKKSVSFSDEEEKQQHEENG
ncbi:MAG: hypothetical protein Q9220_002684 [cf. Caloplaca sp. 1 TL-2023]